MRLRYTVPVVVALACHGFVLAQAYGTPYDGGRVVPLAGAAPRVPHAVTVLTSAARVRTAALAVHAVQQEIVGDWRGALEVPGGSLPVVFHISETDGHLTGTLDSPSQGATGIPIDRVVFDNGHLSLQIAAIGGEYEGELQSDGTIAGRWSQGGAALELTLERTQEAAAASKRPQEPTPPFPYDSEPVRITAGPGVTLVGKLTLPRGRPPFPAVILISGSGLQDRDSTLFAHRPFLVLADHLTRHGVAVLRLDDRGTGESTGPVVAATSQDLADDALAAVEFLADRSEIGPVGLAGHSEGGLIAPMVANRSSDVEFVVLMAGPGLTGEEVLYRQGEMIIGANGGTREVIDTNRETQAALFGALKEEADLEIARERLEGILRDSFAQLAPGVSDEQLEAQVQAQLTQLTHPWFRYFLTYAPRPALRALTCPVLAINGEKDTQVAAKSLSNAKKATRLDHMCGRFTRWPTGFFHGVGPEHRQHHGAS